VLGFVKMDTGTKCSDTEYDGSGGPWEWRTLEVADTEISDPGSGGP